MELEPITWTRAFLADLAHGADVCFAPDFQGERPPLGDYGMLDAVMKRNLVFVSWRRANDAGDDETGTWVLSWDREGRLLSLAVL